MTIRERMIVQAFAQLGPNWYQRERMLRHTFGTSPTLVHAEILGLLERADVEAEFPVEVHRLLRLRDARRAVRSAQRGVGHPVGQ